MIALLLTSQVAASTAAPTAQKDAKAWRAWMIRVNTKNGSMKNKRYVPEDKMTIASWNGVIDTTLADQKHDIAIAPASLESALAHEVAYYGRVKQRGYDLDKAKLGTFTRAELTKVVNFQRTKCGITIP